MRHCRFFLLLILVLFLAGCSGSLAISEAVSPEVAGETKESDTSSSERIDQRSAKTPTLIIQKVDVEKRFFA